MHKMHHNRCTWFKNRNFIYSITASREGYKHRVPYTDTIVMATVLPTPGEGGWLLMPDRGLVLLSRGIVWGVGQENFRGQRTNFGAALL